MTATRYTAWGWVGVLAAGTLLCRTVSAQTTWDNGGGDYQWANAVNWNSNLLPTGSDEVRVNGFCSPSQPVQLTGVGTALRINLGVASSDAGYLDIVNGWLTNTTTSLECNIGNDGVGQVRLASGVLYTSNTLNVGYAAGSQGTCLVAGGQLRTRSHFYVGRSGTGTLVQTGGSITPLGNNSITIGSAPGSFGTAIISNGLFGVVGNGYSIYVGGSGSGELYVRGGTVYLPRHLYVGNASTAKGYLRMESGTLAAAYDMHVGAAGRGTMVVGSPVNGRSLSIGELASGQGEVQALTGATLTLGSNGATVVGDLGYGLLAMRGGTVTAGSNSGDLIVRRDVAAGGVVSGWGAHTASRQINNNGVIIADGEGVERDLNLTTLDGYQSVAAWTNTLDNVTTNGWYARSKGRLLLCARTIPVGAGAVLNWGESIGDTQIDLVNSLRFTFASVTTQGALSVSLLAADRSDVPAPPSGTALIGVWKGTFGGVFTTVGIEARYDHVAAGNAAVKLMRWNTATSQWALLGDTALSGCRVAATGVAALGTEKIGLIAAVVPRGAAGTQILVR